MKFLIERVSTSGYKDLPCKNAKLAGETNQGYFFEIEINELKDITDLVNEVGKIIIDPKEGITIYDDYIE